MIRIRLTTQQMNETSLHVTIFNWVYDHGGKVRKLFEGDYHHHCYGITCLDKESEFAFRIAYADLVV